MHDDRPIFTPAGSYVDSTLLPDERVIYRAEVSWFSQFWYIILCFTIVIAYLNVISTELAITNKRIIAKFGFIRRETVELNLNKVESITIEQGVLGRIFNFGTIVVHGTGGIRTPVPYISNPLEFRRRVAQQTT